MKVEVEKLIHISVSDKEYNTLVTAMNILKEIYEELDEDIEVAKESYDAAELLDSIIDVVSVQ